MIDTSFEDYVK